MKKKYAAAIVSTALLAAACATVPVTGRKQMLIIPDAQVTALAVDSYKDLLSKSKLSQDQEKVAMIRRVGQRIAAVTGQKDYQWEFNLIDDDKMVNAFCMPGGKVAFYTGILPIADNEARVAAVMGHEIAHAIAKHGAERMSQQLIVSGLSMGLDVYMREKPEGARQMALGAFGAAATLGAILPFSRSHESEADHIGLLYMAKAGYDPHEAVHLWERMEKLSGGAQPPEFISTHPSHGRRISDLNSWMPEALQVYQPGKAH